MILKFIYKNVSYYKGLLERALNFIKKRMSIVVVCLLFISLIFSAYFFKKIHISNQINSIAKLQTILKKSKYDLWSIRQKKKKVPRIFIKYFPKDFDTIKNKFQRKNIFIQVVLPLILKVNEEITFERQKLIQIKYKLQNKIALKTYELHFLRQVSEKYKVYHNNIDELLSKVDVIPVSLALAQAIQETGWGSSYFLLNGNSLFAEWTWKSDGMIPRAREKNLRHRIKTFSTLIESVRSYAMILNSSKYYKYFRKTRKTLSKVENKIYSGISLSSTMKYYSTTPEYLFLVNKIIDKNFLTDFDLSELE